jgi:hypothetical protein
VLVQKRPPLRANVNPVRIVFFSCGIATIRHSTNEQISYPFIIILFLDTNFFFFRHHGCVAILSSALLIAAGRKALFEKANVVAIPLQNIRLPTPVFA